MLHTIPLNGKWFQFSDDVLPKMSEENRELVLQREFKAALNPLAHFIAHGRKWSDKTRVVANGAFEIQPSEYPKEWLNDGVAFLNDWESDLCIMLGPNQMGKSVIGTAWSGLRIVPMNEHDPVFTETPVIYKPWMGPRKWVVASYSWTNVATIWERYQQFLPRHELRNYAPNWGKYPGEEGRQKTLSFGDGRAKKCELACGSMITFLCYTQPQHAWEGFDSDGAHFDEQPSHEKFVGWQRGTTTRGNYTPCCMTLTGHVLEDRPDTGAAGWIKRELWDVIRNTESSVTTG